MTRPFNFSPGPAALPDPVLRRCADLTLSSIDLLAICTISVSPRTSSSRIAPVDESTGFMSQLPLPDLTST